MRGNLIKGLIGILILIVIGTLGFHFFEHYSIVESIYMTVITLSTVGFGAVRPLTETGMIFVSILIVFGIGVFGFVGTSIISFFVSGELKNIFKERKMSKNINQLEDHVIVCGYGSVGKEACLNLKLEKQEFIVVENDFDRIQTALKDDLLAVMGDATDEKVLEKCVIGKARGLISTMSDTSTNVYISLAAKELNKTINIVARGTGERSEKLLYRAGADKVVSPAQIGARRMVMTMCHNASIELINKLVRDKNFNVRFVEAEIPDGNVLTGKSLLESDIRRHTGGIMIIGIKPLNGEVKLNPSADEIISSDDKLILLGSLEQIANFRKYTGVETREIN
ncbi:MAG: potassium channel protein [Candidatus Delongbacteria bacterium]|nr:potassium channel protein [Candidatus Delongbacteria bacterium]MBN2836981.1 potassium channel protein [Candidatus Delongbacteria bacterium]